MDDNVTPTLQERWYWDPIAEAAQSRDESSTSQEDFLQTIKHRIYDRWAWTTFCVSKMSFSTREDAEVFGRFYFPQVNRPGTAEAMATPIGSHSPHPWRLDWKFWALMGVRLTMLVSLLLVMYQIGGIFAAISGACLVAIGHDFGLTHATLYIKRRFSL